MARWIPFLVALIPGIAHAQEAGSNSAVEIGSGGASGVWILANISYAGMRAQANPSKGWMIAAFLFGFPGTLLSYLAVAEGGERAYGIDCPRKPRENADDDVDVDAQT